MKKSVALILIVFLVAMIFAGCSNGAKEENAESKVPAETQETKNTQEAKQQTQSGEIEKVGLGHIISTAKSKEASDQENAQAQANVTIAAVAFDKDGKVVDAKLDVAQTKIDFDENMAITSDKEAEVPTKKELKEEYGMKNASEIGKEWYEQAEAFEDWMVGKTIDEITGLKVKERDEEHTAVPDDPELTSSVTMDVGDFLAAVEESWKNAESASGAKTLSLAVNTTIDKSKDASEEQSALAQANTTMAAVTFDENGNVVTPIIDEAQVKVEFDQKGKIISDIHTEGQTKKELKEEYGMKNVSEIGKEWYEQIEALEDWMSGKSVEDIVNLSVKERDKEHPTVPNDPELTSSVTVTVGQYLDLIKKAAENIK
ncbi:hypothetical protein [Garciella nitratireducens]|uniref:hypothetical protein n=1 Tax=Garciella nitratireducens TaxID=218205 RepID=UPI000DE965C0|nr:hypothetical protein [Garciella nitratireducens]RBP38955.1 hypothetical protein DFR81_11711 [Garciella nitratireducens]